MSSQPVKIVEFELPHLDNSGSSVAQAWARTPAPLAPAEKAALKQRIRELLKEKQAVLVAHYYVDSDIQDLAEETGGCVSDSLEMARFGRDHPAQTLVVAGVRFMGETAKILSPEKTVLMPDLDATCSLDLGCPADQFSAFCDAHPDRTVVVYANTSAAVKARADWMVTSSIGLKIVEHLHKQGKKILFGPDRHLGDYIQRQTGADMLLWQGSCVVHDEFKAIELELLKKEHPQAKVLVHPESPPAVIALADVVGSDLGDDRRGARHGRAGVHRRHRSRHPAQDAAGGAGQGLHRGADRRRQRHLQELRALPVDGDERLARRGQRAANRAQPDPGRSGNQPPGGGVHRSHAGIRSPAKHERAPVGRPGQGAATVCRRWSGMSHSLNNPFAPFDPALEIALASNIAAAVAEDVGSGDLTGLLVPAGEWVRARVLVRETAILCGAPWFAGVMREIDPALRIDWRYAEGATMHADSEVCIIDGPARSLLTAERSALNFLQLLSGVATATNRYVAAIAGTGAAILDTRKTLPGLRLAQKYAVRVGGGQNQRLALYDGILIKENHIAAAGGVSAAVRAAQALDAGVTIQVEVETLAQLEEALF